MIAGERLNRFVRSGFLLAPFILLACSSGGVSANNKIYAIGGVNFSSDPNGLIYSYSTEEYNPATDTWVS